MQREIWTGFLMEEMNGYVWIVVMGYKVSRTRMNTTK